jgi:hypothetical protein
MRNFDVAASVTPKLPAPAPAITLPTVPMPARSATVTALANIRDQPGGKITAQAMPGTVCQVSGLGEWLTFEYGQPGTANHIKGYIHQSMVK